MNRVMQPLGEQFLYCSPESMCREYYRWLPLPCSRTAEREQQARIRRSHEKRNRK